MSQRSKFNVTRTLEVQRNLYARMVRHDIYHDIYVREGAGVVLPIVHRIIQRGRYRNVRRACFCFVLYNHHFSLPSSASLEDLPSATFWTSRGLRCHPFHPPAPAFFLSSIGFGTPSTCLLASNFAKSRLAISAYASTQCHSVLTG